MQIPVKLILLPLPFWLLMPACSAPSPEAHAHEAAIKACVASIPYMEADSVIHQDKTLIYHLTDAHQVADWFLYDELFLYLWNQGCISHSLIAGSAIDSLQFTLAHAQGSINRKASTAQLTQWAGLRLKATAFHEFIHHGLARPDFRDELILLAHLYGKALDPNPQDGTMYQENVLEFLLSYDRACQQQALTEPDKVMFQQLKTQLATHQNVLTLLSALSRFEACSGKTAFR